MTRIVEYEDIGESPVEEGGRLEWQHFRQDPPSDFTDPCQVESKVVGAKKRTTTIQASSIHNGPCWKNGVRTAWQSTVDHTGETVFIPIETATQLAESAGEVIPAPVYINLVKLENAELAAQLEAQLAEMSHHTAHHTTSADMQSRTTTLFKQAQLSYIEYQDKQIGQGIEVPPIVHRAQDPASVVEADGVTWN